VEYIGSEGGERGGWSILSVGFLVCFRNIGEGLGT
jgi:hypothetical protein